MSKNATHRHWTLAFAPRSWLIFCRSDSDGLPLSSVQVVMLQLLGHQSIMHAAKVAAGRLLYTLFIASLPSVSNPTVSSKQLFLLHFVRTACSQPRFFISVVYSLKLLLLLSI